MISEGAMEQGSSCKRVAVIPARGGSKRIPGKNVKEFLGRPVLTWPLKAVLDSNLFDRVIVSTDDSQIGDIANDFGAQVVKRPASLADDFSNTTEVLKSVIHEAIESEVNPWIYKIYPTSPLISSVIEDFIMFAEETSCGFALSIAKSPVPIQRALRLLHRQILEFREPEYALTRTQDLEPTFFDAGKMYAGRKSDWLACDAPLLSSARGFELPDWLSVDMDTLEDWELAEYKFKRHFGV
jgi:pseudaminic acid cytidylyltransferase